MPKESFLQRHFANLRHIRDTFRIDPTTADGTKQIAPWLSGTVQLVHPAIPGAFSQFSALAVRTFPSPAAGVDFTVVVPPNEAWQVLALRFAFTTDANVANRAVIVVLEEGSNIFASIVPTSVQTAGLIVAYSYLRQQGYEKEIATNKVQGYPNLVLGPGMGFSSVIGSIQVGDQVAGITALLDVFAR